MHFSQYDFRDELNKFSYLSATLALDLDTCLAAAEDTSRGSSGVTRSLHCPDDCSALPWITVSVCKAWSVTTDNWLSSSCVSWLLTLEFKKTIITDEFRNLLLKCNHTCHNDYIPSSWHSTGNTNVNTTPNILWWARYGREWTDKEGGGGGGLHHALR